MYLLILLHINRIMIQKFTHSLKHSVVNIYNITCNKYNILINFRFNNALSFGDSSTLYTALVTNNEEEEKTQH